MGSISSWILSIAGVISLSVIVELMLPEGSVNRYIRSVLSFIIVLVIIAPLPSLIGKQFSLSNIDLGAQYETSEDYLYQNNISLAEATQKDLVEAIKQRGYDNVSVSVTCEKLSKTFKIKAIYVELKNLVILDKAEHKDIVDIQSEILSLIERSTNVKKEKVHFER